MTCNYLEIQRDNIIRYGTDIGRIGRILLADRYDERTHFIFELLQNAEDALARLRQPPRSRAVSFHLDDDSLRVGHYGIPFDEEDVRGGTDQNPVFHLYTCERCRPEARSARGEASMKGRAQARPARYASAGEGG